MCLQKILSNIMVNLSGLKNISQKAGKPEWTYKFWIIQVLTTWLEIPLDIWIRREKVFIIKLATLGRLNKQTRSASLSVLTLVKIFASSLTQKEESVRYYLFTWPCFYCSLFACISQTCVLHLPSYYFVKNILKGKTHELAKYKNWK